MKTQFSPRSRRPGYETLEQRHLLSATSLLSPTSAPESDITDAAVGTTAPSILFIRGGDRTGGFLEANNDTSRTEHLGDINNFQTFGGNHGWGELRNTLENAGFAVSQITEGSETASGPADGIAIDFAAMDLSQYDALVFGSNNAVYNTESIDAVEDYMRGGGSALFISDANFGGDWADSSNSDQQFLDRFGLIMHQDQGTYSITRNGPSDFNVPDHPILTNVDRFDGEGVTPIEIGTPAAGVTPIILANSEGNTRLNEPPFGNRNQGPSRQSSANDAALLVADVDAGKLVGHFDRNTFFNQNGAGTNINRFDNKQFALNLFGWMVGAFDPLPGDYNADSMVDDADYAVWRSNYGQTGANPADGNSDGVVDAADYTVWRSNEDAMGPMVNLSLPCSQHEVSMAASSQESPWQLSSTEAAEEDGFINSPLAGSFVNSADHLLLAIQSPTATPTNDSSLDSMTTSTGKVNAAEPTNAIEEAFAEIFSSSLGQTKRD